MRNTFLHNHQIKKLVVVILAKLVKILLPRVLTPAKSAAPPTISIAAVAPHPVLPQDVRVIVRRVP